MSFRKPNEPEFLSADAVLVQAWSEQLLGAIVPVEGEALPPKLAADFMMQFLSEPGFDEVPHGYTGIGSREQQTHPVPHTRLSLSGGEQFSRFFSHFVGYFQDLDTWQFFATPQCFADCVDYGEEGAAGNTNNWLFNDPGLRKKHIPLGVIEGTEWTPYSQVPFTGYLHGIDLVATFENIIGMAHMMASSPEVPDSINLWCSDDGSYPGFRDNSRSAFGPVQPAPSPQQLL